MQTMDWKYQNVDWNEVWRDLRAQKKARGTHRIKNWDSRANEFARAVARGDYVEQMLAICAMSPEATVLDIGAAAGTLAVPLALRAREVTALEPSGAMRAILARRCQALGLENVRIVAGRWEDDWERLEIGTYDIAIASRSLVVENLSTAIDKLCRHTRKRVYLSTLVGDGPYDRKLIGAVGRKFEPGIDYIVVYNYLRQIGIYANLQFTVHRELQIYADIDEAVLELSWMVDEIDAQETTRLREYLSRTLVKDQEGWRMPYTSPVRWAVIWWDQEESCAA